MSSLELFRNTPEIRMRTGLPSAPVSFGMVTTSSSSTPVSISTLSLMIASITPVSSGRDSYMRPAMISMCSGRSVSILTESFIPSASLRMSSSSATLASVAMYFTL